MPTDPGPITKALRLLAEEHQRQHGAPPTAVQLVALLALVLDKRAELENQPPAGIAKAWLAEHRKER